MISGCINKQTSNGRFPGQMEKRRGVTRELRGSIGSAFLLFSRPVRDSGVAAGGECSTCTGGEALTKEPGKGVAAFGGYSTGLGEPGGWEVQVWDMSSD